MHVGLPRINDSTGKTESVLFSQLCQIYFQIFDNINILYGYFDEYKSIAIPPIGFERNGIPSYISARALAKVIKDVGIKGEHMIHNLQIYIPISDQTRGSDDSVFCEILFSELNKTSGSHDSDFCEKLFYKLNNW